MKKTLLTILLLILVVSMTLSLTACGEKQFTVTFDSNGGSEVASQVVVEGSKANEPTTPTKEGHTFLGWYNGETEYKFDAVVTDDLTLTAKWEEIAVAMCTITFESNGGSEVASQVVTEGSKVTTPAEPTRTDYNFVGWYSDENGEYKYNFNAKVFENLTIYAVWEEDINYTEGLEYALYGNGTSYQLEGMGALTLSEVVIPPEYQGKPVTKIADSAFEDCTSLTSVIIGGSVTSISSDAFKGCTSLVNIIIPDSVTIIGESSFENCTSLTNVTIGGSVNGIWDDAFKGCTGLANIIIPDSVAYIGAGVFSDTAWYSNQADGVVYAGRVAYGYNGIMPSDTKIALREGTVSICAEAFSGYSDLTSITIPASVTRIFLEAFFRCASLRAIEVDSHNQKYKSVDGNLYSKDGTKLVLYPRGKSDETFEIPDYVTSIGYEAFSGCTSLTSVTIPDSVTCIEHDAFSSCSSLMSIAIPNSVTSIGNSAFYDCSSLTSITIPDSVTSIDLSAFYGCTSLTSITIPDSVTSIGRWAFSGCAKLTIYCEAESQPSGWDSNWNDDNCTVVWGYKQP